MSFGKSTTEKCILIYEDDLEILELCKIILDEPGRKVETRSSCENILQDIELVQPDVILMDLWIPKIGGEKAILLLKNEADKQHIPVILFSANDGLEEICQRIKANGYLKKPFDITALKSTIDSYI